MVNSVKPLGGRDILLVEILHLVKAHCVRYSQAPWSQTSQEARVFEVVRF